jgi:hypothetical protein
MKRHERGGEYVDQAGKTARSVGGALDGSRMSELGECLMSGVVESLMPKRRRGGCKKGGGRR